MKRYKLIPLALILFTLPDAGFGQPKAPIDTVILRGYVIVQLKKQEIIDKKDNQKNNRYPIDYFFKTFFLPFNDLDLENNIDSIIRFRPNYAVFLPPAERKEMIDRFCKNEFNLFKNNFSLKNAILPPLFEIKTMRYKEDLFKCYFIECKAIKILMPNNYDNTFYLNVPYNKQYKNLECYFVYDTIILQPIESVSSNIIRQFNSVN